MKMLKEIGLIGLGVMGKNIALNLSDNGVAIKAFNDSKEKLEEIKKEFSDTFEGHTDINNLINSLSKPRTILLMVPSGKATKDVIEKIKDLLDEGDLVIDGGNSFYLDSEENGLALEQKKINFMGMGVSGGEEGARNGPAIMVGYKNKISEDLKNTLSAISAKTDQDCIGFYKGYGSGHFIKMVHNGIEYAEMQLISEIYDILRKNGKNNDYISEVFSKLSDSSQGSYLFEITHKIINKKIEGDSILDKISPIARHKGTGKWTIESSLELGVAVPSVSSAFESRIISQNTLSSNQELTIEKGDIRFEDLYKAIYQVRVSIFMQGLNLINKGGVENKWNIDLNDVLENWKSGCIVKTKLLNDLPLLIGVLNNEPSKEFNSLLDVTPLTSDFIQKANRNSIPTPCMSASLNWILSTFAHSLPTNLIQAQRDYFGSHTVELLNSPEEGPVHIDW